MILENIKYSETIGHLLIKKFFYDNIPLANPIKTIEQELKVGNQKADVYIELDNGKKIAIEIQHSKISKVELIRRTKEYNRKEIHVLWVLNGHGPYYKKIPKNEDGVIISVSEKELHSMYRGRVYYINAGADGIETSVYALHFTPYFERKISRYGIKYYKNSKNKLSTVSGEIASLQLKTFRNKGLKLAQFFDENLKTLCTSEVVQFLNDFIAYQSINHVAAKKLLPNGLPLGVLIKKFYRRYGIFLLFDVLRYLKFLTVRDAKYMLEKELWLRKCILN